MCMMPPRIVLKAASEMETDAKTAASAVSVAHHRAKKRYDGLVAKYKENGRI